MIPLNTYDFIKDRLGVSGLNLKASDVALEDNETPNCKNVIFGKTYSVQSRGGFSRLNNIQYPGVTTGFYQLRKSDGNNYTIIGNSTNLYLGIDTAATITSQTVGHYYDFATFNDYAAIVDGVDPNYKTDGINFYPIGTAAPLTAPTLNAHIAGANLTFPGNYIYLVTFVDNNGEESSPSPASAVIPTIAVTQDLRINIPIPPAPAAGVTQQVVARNIYRTANNGAIQNAGLVGTINDIVTTTFDDHIPDSGIGVFIEFDNDKPPVLVYIETAKNRWFGVSPSNPSRLLFSKQFRQDQWPILFNIDISPDDGDIITGLVGFFDQLVIYKRKSIYVLSGNDETDFTVQRVQTDDRVGSLNNRCPAVINNQVGLLSEKGPYAFDGLRTEYIGLKVENVFDNTNVDSAKRFNWVAQNQCVGINYRNKSRNWYFLAIPTGGSSTNNTVLVYDYVLQAWTYFDGINIASMYVFDVNQEPALYSGDYNGWLWRQDNTNNDGLVHTPAFSTSNANGVNTLRDDSLAAIPPRLATAGGANTLTDATLLTGVILNQYIGFQIYIESGTGAGQVRTISANTASPGPVFTVSVAWGVMPDNTSVYIVGGLIVNSAAGVRVKIRSGTGEGQIRLITSNTPTVITVTPNWTIIPNTTSNYSIGFIEKVYDSKQINYDLPDIYKRLRYVKSNLITEANYFVNFFLRFDSFSGNNTVSAISLGGNAALWDSAIFDQDIWDAFLFALQRSSVEGGHIHDYVQWSLQNDGGNEPFTLNSIGLMWQQKGVRH